MIYSNEAEQAVIGSLVLDIDCQNSQDAVSILTVDDFSPSHQPIYQTIKALMAASKEVDMITVSEAVNPNIELTMRLDEQPLMAYLASLAESSVNLELVSAYVQIIKDCSKKRALINASHNLHESLSENIKSVGELRDDLLSQIEALDDDSQQNSYEMKDVFKMFLQDVDKRQRLKEGELLGLSTGFKALDDHLLGLEAGNLTVIGARPSMGKDQPLDSKVLLSTGKFIRMGDLKTGDSLASVDGRESIVTAIYPQGEQDVYQLTVCDGRTVECGLGHLWNVESSRFKGKKTVTTQEIIRLLGTTRYKNRLRLSNHDGELSRLNYIDGPYWLIGFLIGDGGLTGNSVRFSTAEPEILDKICSFGFSVKKTSSNKKNYDYRIHDREGVLKTLLKKNGLMGKYSHEKRINKEIFTASKRDRQMLLAGLIESDGWIQSNSVQYSTASKGLAFDIQRLVRSLGGTCRFRVKEISSYKYKGEYRPCRDAHILTIGYPAEEICTTKRILSKISKRRKTTAPIVRTVEHVGVKKTQCITVSHPDHTYITDGYLLTHNTAVSLSIARHQAIDNEKVVVYLNFEMNKVQLGRRLVSQIARVDQRKFKQPNTLEPSELTGLKAAGQMLAENKRLIVVDCHGSNMHQIKALLKKLNKKYDFDIVICDYLQKISHDHNNQVKELGAICSMFRDLGEICGFHTMMLAQLNRALEQRPNKRPVMSDLRASGEIEQDADDILMLYRDEVYNENSESKGILEVIPVKAREGETGKAILLSSHLLRQGLITDLEPSYQNNYNK